MKDNSWQDSNDDPICQKASDPKNLLEIIDPTSIFKNMSADLIGYIPQKR